MNDHVIKVHMGSVTHGNAGPMKIISPMMIRRKLAVEQYLMCVDETPLKQTIDGALFVGGHIEMIYRCDLQLSL